MSKRCVFFGFGVIARTALPLAAKILPVSEFVILDGRVLGDAERALAKGLPVTFERRMLTEENIESVVSEIVREGDIVFDFLACVDSLQVLMATNKKNALYLNCCMEEWDDHPFPTEFARYARLHEHAPLMHATANVDAGANPGIITHFVRLALFRMARAAVERGVPDAAEIQKALDAKDCPTLCTMLKVDTIHVTDIDTIEPHDEHVFDGKFVNTWCAESFQLEWNINGEVCIGSEDKEYLEGPECTRIPEAHPPFTRVPFPVHLRTAVPGTDFVGRVVRHPETLDIGKMMFDAKTGHAPTVCFVYQPSRLARESTHKPDWKSLPTAIMTEMTAGPLKGGESMGALLISAREDVPPRWFGSMLSCEQARAAGCIQSPTSLQVASSAVAHMKLALEQPERGLCLPHDWDSEELVRIAEPYLGTVFDGDIDHRLPTHWCELRTDEAL